jgi:hypothetical protein
MARAKAATKPKKCLTCKNKVHARGLCIRCYRAYSAAVERQEITEAEAVAKGLVAPRKRNGRPAKSGFAQALEQAKR